MKGWVVAPSLRWARRRRVRGSCRASQVELSSQQRDGRARGCGGKAGCGRCLLWVVTNPSQQISWSRRLEEKEARRFAGGRQGRGLGQVRGGEQEGKDHADAERRPGGQRHVRLQGPWGTVAGVGISGLPAGLQAAPERAGLRPAQQSQPRKGPPRSSSGCRGCSLRGQQGHPGHPRHPRFPVQAAPPHLSRTWRRHCGSSAR